MGCGPSRFFEHDPRSNKKQRGRLLAVDPHAFGVKHSSHATKTMTNDQKIGRLIAFYQQHGRWHESGVKTQGLFWKSSREAKWKAVFYPYLFLGSVLWTVMEAIALISQ